MKTEQEVIEELRRIRFYQPNMNSKKIENNKSRIETLQWVLKDDINVLDADHEINDGNQKGDEQ